MAEIRITLADAAARVERAIELGRLTAQMAPPGHRLHAAIAEAQAVADEIREAIPLLYVQTPVVFPGSRVWQQMQAAIDGIEAAAADVRTDPAKPLPTTVWRGGGIPWGWIGAGAGVLAAAAIIAGGATGGRRRA